MDSSPHAVVIPFAKQMGYNDIGTYRQSDKEIDEQIDDRRTCADCCKGCMSGKLADYGNICGVE